MTRDQQRLADYLSHILQAIERIHRYVEDIDEVVFLRNEMAQDAVIRNFEIIGEASHNIEQHYPAFAAEHPELPLAFAYQMRNAVAHGYLLQGRPGDCLADHPCRPAWTVRAGAGDSTSLVSRQRRCGQRAEQITCYRLDEADIVAASFTGRARLRDR